MMRPSKGESGDLDGLFSDGGHPVEPIRLMVGMLFLKHIYVLSDDGVCERWVHDPCFQHFTARPSSSTPYRMNVRA